MKNKLLVIFGYLFLGVGALGILLPVLPTTPFIILSVICFSNKPEIQDKLRKNVYLKEYIEHYESGKPISTKTFIKGISFLWITLIASTLVIKIYFVKIMLIFIGIMVSTHLVWIYKKPNIKLEREMYDKTKKINY